MDDIETPLGEQIDGVDEVDDDGEPDFTKCPYCGGDYIIGNECMECYRII